MAKLIGIAVRPPKHQSMQELDSVDISVNEGVAGDKRNRPGKRQITLLSLSAWQAACAELKVNLPWTTRRANLLVDHLNLVNTTGATIVIGDVVLEITGETDPCKIMDTAHAGLLEALKPDWRGGVTCRVIKGGHIALGTSIQLHAS